MHFPWMFIYMDFHVGMHRNLNVNSHIMDRRVGLGVAPGDSAWAFLLPHVVVLDVAALINE